LFSDAEIFGYVADNKEMLEDRYGLDTSALTTPEWRGVQKRRAAKRQ